MHIDRITTAGTRAQPPRLPEEDRQSDGFELSLEGFTQSLYKPEKTNQLSQADINNTATPLIIQYPSILLLRQQHLNCNQPKDRRKQKQQN